jgi:hypothetical protein
MKVACSFETRLSAYKITQSEEVEELEMQNEVKKIRWMRTG